MYLANLKCLFLTVPLKFSLYAYEGVFSKGSLIFDGIVKRSVANRYQRRAAKLTQEFTAGANEV